MMPLPVHEVCRHDLQVPDKQVDGPVHRFYRGVVSDHVRVGVRSGGLQQAATEPGLGREAHVSHQLYPIFQGESLKLLLLHEQVLHGLSKLRCGHLITWMERQRGVGVGHDRHAHLHGVGFVVKGSKGEGVVGHAAAVWQRHVHHRALGVGYRGQHRADALAVHLIEVAASGQGQDADRRHGVYVGGTHGDGHRLAIPGDGVGGVVRHHGGVIDAHHVQGEDRLHRALVQALLQAIAWAVKSHRQILKRVLPVEVSCRHIAHLPIRGGHGRGSEGDRGAVRLEEVAVLRHGGDQDNIPLHSHQHDLRLAVLTEQHHVADGRRRRHKHDAVARGPEDLVSNWHALSGGALKLVEAEVRHQASLCPGEDIPPVRLPVVEGVGHVHLRLQSDGPQTELVDEPGETLADEHV
mmetsp:Transcript_35052/g.58950  ORF Transcript_35052/g.58950 Transcript_35052/m.58950 type:complete len:408 (-) Transcript_35052:15166-16389(-)